VGSNPTIPTKVPIINDWALKVNSRTGLLMRERIPLCHEHE